MNEIKRTQEVYGFLWDRGGKNGAAPQRWHFHDMQETVPEPIVKGKIGLEIGCGYGYDTLIMAKNNPEVKILSFDISDGVFRNREMTASLKNVFLIKASALNIPLKDNAFDFAYSYGVLHHLPDPETGIKEINRVIKKNAPLFLYLYEDHARNKLKRAALRMVNILRHVTTKMPAKLLYLLSYLASPFIVILFSFPAMVLAGFKTTSRLSDKIPFNYGTHLFSVAADLYDRFGTPIEHRFSREEIIDLFDRTGFSGINIAKIKSKAGWVIWGYKN